MTQKVNQSNHHLGPGFESRAVLLQRWIFPSVLWL